MSHTENKSMVENKKIVIFGAGKIGRSFIGQLFGCNGYKVVFVDVDPGIIKLLNERGNYRVVIKGEKEEEIIVPNVEAISAFERGKVADAVSTAGIMAISVGKNALEKVVPAIAEGLMLRYRTHPEAPLDIILAENMRSAADFINELLEKYLPSDYPADKLVGLIETSIGKMVPIITATDLEKDPLVVFAEPYNTLILDGKGFKSPTPGIKGLAPKSNIKAWVDRKAFIHNLGHATAAYYGHYLHPEAVFIYEVLDDINVFDFTREVMLQSAEILLAAYPDDFTLADLDEHINDLLHRFRNKALRDTIYRVGQDLPRKLGSDDRFMGAVHLADHFGKPYYRILEAMSYGLTFNVADESGISSPGDLAFLKQIAEDFEVTLVDRLGYDPIIDRSVIDGLKILYKLNSKISNSPINN
jgi:mannitol-1-phosphate 5-dehydrogenase